MLAKTYVYTWLLIGAIAGLFSITGNMTVLTMAIFGTLAFGMTFIGMMNVLPSVLASPRTALPEPRKETVVESAELSVPNGSQTIRV